MKGLYNTRVSLERIANVKYTCAKNEGAHPDVSPELFVA
jgi:hypothetical protein